VIAAIRTLTPTRIRTLATGFAGVHTLNAGLTMIYTLIQTLVFSRVLDHRLYSMAIVATAVGLYLMPMNQAVARANFVVLRERAVKTTHRGAPEAAAAFNMNQIILMLVPFLVPLTLGVANGAEYAAFTCYLFFTTYSNIWYFEIQMSMMAVDQALPFERLSFLRRVVNYATLILLAFTRDFLLCNVLWAAQTIAFHLYVTQRMARGWGLFGWPHGLTGGAVKRHSVRLWVSLQATGAEWLTLNGPYAVFVARFGVGPGVVTVDAVLKLLRIVVSEIALPRVSRALLMGDVKKGHMPVMLALGGAGLRDRRDGLGASEFQPAARPQQRGAARRRRSHRARPDRRGRHGHRRPHHRLFRRPPLDPHPADHIDHRHGRLRPVRAVRPRRRGPGPVGGGHRHDHHRGHRRRLAGAHPAPQGRPL